MNIIQSNNQYKKVSKNLVKKRYLSTSSLIKEMFYTTPTKAERAFFVEMEGFVDNSLLILEDAIKQGRYDTEDAETGETIPGSFQSVPEEDTKVALILPVINSLFEEHNVLTESMVGDYKVDIAIGSGSSNYSALDKEVNIEAKRIMYKTRKDGVVCMDKEQLENTFFKMGRKPGLKYKNGCYRIVGSGGEQTIRNNANGHDTLSSGGISVYTNGLIYAVSVTYNDVFTEKEIREFSKNIKILRDNEKENNGQVFTGAFGHSEYPMFVFSIKEYDEKTGKYVFNVGDLIAFRNMLYSFIHNTKEWRIFREKVHDLYIDDLRTYLTKE